MTNLEWGALLALVGVVLTFTHTFAYLVGKSKGLRALNARLARAGSNVRV